MQVAGLAKLQEESKRMLDTNSSQVDGTILRVELNELLVEGHQLRADLETKTEEASNLRAEHDKLMAQVATWGEVCAHF